MLKHIPKNISPDLLKVLAEMGHGDEIVLADGNFPGASCAQRIVRYDAAGVVVMLDAILQLFPLDEYVQHPVSVMKPGAETSNEPEIWNRYREIIVKYAKKSYTIFEEIERFAFYEKAKKAYAIVTTHEESLYANIILKKGLL